MDSLIRKDGSEQNRLVSKWEMLDCPLASLVLLAKTIPRWSKFRHTGKKNVAFRCWRIIRLIDYLVSEVTVWKWPDNLGRVQAQNIANDLFKRGAEV